MIGARFATSASTEKASTRAMATTGMVAVDRDTEPTRRSRTGNATRPTTPETTRKPTASPIVDDTVATSTEPCWTMRVTTVRMMSPSTSSVTAAPRTVRASDVDSARRSPKTRAVMPMLVAVSAAPTNSDVLVDSPRARAAVNPSASGRATPISPTPSDDRPTRRSSVISVSMPTWARSTMTPISARTKRMSPVEIHPRTDGPSTMPTAISPITTGTCRRSKISAATLAMTKIRVRSSRIRPRSTPPVDAATSPSISSG